MILRIFDGMGHIALEVLLALSPLLLVYMLFQIFVLKLPKKQVMRIISGFILTFLGLVLFLQGVNIGFMPVGKYIGETLGESSLNWILVPIGLLLGFVVIFAEPAVQVLTLEVEKVSSGYINRKIILYFLCIGVSVSVGLSIIRILVGISLWYFIVPGYILVFILSRHVKDIFVGIAFDAGGVATGPMTVTFISSLAIGIATVMEGRDPLLDGFGLISLVALAPILSVLILGFLYGRKEKAYDNEQ